MVYEEGEDMDDSLQALTDSTLQVSTVLPCGEGGRCGVYMG